jgi:hypothetical protein
MTEQNERVHSSFTVSKLINDILDHLGIVLVAEAGHGKSFTAFTIAKEAMKRNDITVIVFSPSTIWRRNYGSISCVKVGTSSFNPIVENESVKLEPIPIMRDSIFINLDKKWSYAKSAWLEQLLDSKKHLLFEVKYRNGRRIKAFESVVLSYIYEMQERQLENEGYRHHYLIVLEEVQNAFGTYSMNSDDSLELFTIFTQSRSDANIHYIAIGQRLNDISTKIIERLRPLVGMTLGENSLRKIKAMIPEDLRDRIQQLPKRHWLYLDGKENPEITVPTFTKEGKPTLLKPKISEPKAKARGIRARLNRFLDGLKAERDKLRFQRPVTVEEYEAEEEQQDREFEQDTLEDEELDRDPELDLEESESEDQ